MFTFLLTYLIDFKLNPVVTLYLADLKIGHTLNILTFVFNSHFLNILS